MIRVFYDESIRQKVFRVRGGSSQSELPTYSIVANDVVDEVGTISYTARLLYGTQPVSGAFITFTCNGVEDTKVTDTNGYATTSIYLPSEGNYSVVMTSNGVGTTKTITTYIPHDYAISLSTPPSSVIVDSEISITATLTDDSVAVGNANILVSITKDGAYLDGETITTNSSGVATFTYTPTSAGSYGFNFAYDDVDDDVSVTAIAHDYSMTVQASPYIITQGSTSTITATLTDNLIPVEDATITFNGSTTADTNEYGVATYIYTGSTVGTNSISVSFGSISTSIDVTVNPLHDYALTLTGTPIIETGDDGTVTATLTDNGVAVEGETLTYSIEHDGTVIDSGTTTQTNSSGQTTISYTGTGVGDVDVIVSYGMSLQETYELIDAKYYADTNAINSWATSSSGVNTNYTSTYEMTTGDTLVMKLKNVPTSFVCGVTKGSSYCQFMKDNNSYKIYWTGSNSNVSTSITTSSIIKLKLASANSQEWYVDDTLIKTISNHSISSPNPMIRKYQSGTFDMEYIYVI
jgi:hypothetical protein